MTDTITIPPGRTAPPPRVRRAVTLYRVSIAASLVGNLAVLGPYTVAVFTTPMSGQLRTLYAEAMGGVVLLAIGFAALKLYLAARVLAGRGWARFLIAALAALAIVLLAMSVSVVAHGIASGHVVGPPQWAGLVLDVAAIGLTLAALVLLFGRSTSPWWRAGRGPETPSGPLSP